MLIDVSAKASLPINNRATHGLLACKSHAQQMVGDAKHMQPGVSGMADVTAHACLSIPPSAY